MKLLKPSPHRARNDFDLSHRHVLDANFGELLPITCIETVPGDNISLHASDLIRAIPFVSSPFLRAKQHLDVWFVPYHDLWHQFDAFITQKKEPVSSAFQGASFCPHFTMYDMNDGLASNVLSTDVVGRPLQARAFDLLQLLGYGNARNGHVGTGTNTFSVNPFRLAAYNYIWYNEYRQQYYDDGTRILPSNMSGNAAYLFNFDDLACTSEATSNIGSQSYGSDRLAAMAQMRYRTWKKDLFTGVLPSSQFGNVSTGSFDLTFISKYNTGQSYASSDKIGSWASGESYTMPIRNSGGTAVGTIDGFSNVDILTLRKSEAVQIWRENALRAGNHIKDNMLAHYGVASDFNDHRPTYLGSVSAPLNIGDIATTANSSSGINTTVGDIAGKGLSSLSEKVFKFHAKDFGVIMVMFSMLPEAEYEANGIDRCNQLLESEDFFIPEYENLGLEGVGCVNFDVDTGVTGINTIFGYAPRYYAYKTKLDKVFGQFVGSGIFRTWCSQKTDVVQIQSVVGTAAHLGLLYVKPQLFDPNFNVGVSTSPQFLVDVYFDVDAVRPMSVTGLPFSS